MPRATITKQGVSTEKAVSPFNGNVVELAKRYAEMTVDIRKAEEALAEAKGKQAQVERELIELVELADLVPPFNIENLGSVTLVRDISVTTDDKDLLLHSLVNLGKEDLISQQVNMQTLKSFIKERLSITNKQGGCRLLPRGINITPLVKARFTKAAAK
jgi:hypothetical protein